MRKKKREKMPTTLPLKGGERDKDIIYNKTKK